jgi:hypothetical protein
LGTGLQRNKLQVKFPQIVMQIGTFMGLICNHTSLYQLTLLGTGFNVFLCVLLFLSPVFNLCWLIYVYKRGWLLLLLEYLAKHQVQTNFIKILNQYPSARSVQFVSSKFAIKWAPRHLGRNTTRMGSPCVLYGGISSFIVTSDRGRSFAGGYARLEISWCCPMHMDRRAYQIVVQIWKELQELLNYNCIFPK